MPEGDRILSQHEVDALLAAIDSGEVEVTPESTSVPQATLYDFKRPERVGRDQLRAIEALHELYARNLQSALSGMLRTVVDIRITGVDQLTFLEFINSLPNPTVFTVLACDPFPGNFILEINPAVAFAVIERLLGSGRISGSQPERPLTPIEWKLIDTVIGRALDLMREAWAPVAAASFKVSAREANPQLLQIYSPNEAVVSVVMEVSLGEQKGYLNLCIPVMAIEAYLERILSNAQFSSRAREAAPGQEPGITRQLAPAEVWVAAHLPAELLRIGDLQALRPGDLLLTNHRPASPVLVSVEGRPKFLARIGSLKDRRALRVSSLVEPAREPMLQPRSLAVVRKKKGGRRERRKPPSSEHLEGLLRIPLQTAAVLAEKQVRVREVLALRPGQVVEFAKRVDEPIVLRAGDRPLASGIAAKIGEKFGLQITSVAEPRRAAAALGL